MSGQYERALLPATRRSDASRRHGRESFGAAARDVLLVARDAWLHGVAVVLGWALLDLLVGTVVVCAVATAVGYLWPGLFSPALPVPQTPVAGFGR